MSRTGGSNPRRRGTPWSWPRPRARRALLLGAWLGLVLFPGSVLATSLRFFGTGEGGIDRVTIQIDPHKPADVGATDFTLEWWMKAEEGDNASEAVVCDTNDGWILGNILFDRDVYGPGDHGDYGVSLSRGRIAFGVSAGSSGNTICGETVVADGAWHHVAVTRQRSSGRLRIYVDGVLDAEGPGNVGPNADVSYENGRATDHEFDPYLVIGAEKHDADPATYPSYRGWIDEVRVSTIERYTGARFTRPFSPFGSDANTAALYHLDEGAGETIGDASGGGSTGLRRVGGSPAGPEWSSETAPLDSARRVALEAVVSGAGRVVAIANAGDDRLFVVDANGRILAYRVNEEGPFELLGTYLDIQGRVLCCGERGLLGLAFHPSFATNRYFFVYYTREPDGDVVIARYRAPTAGSNLVEPDTERILLTIEHSAFGNHNGGGIAFGPDGYLYVPVGDGGGGGDPLGSGQSVTTHLGKLLRLAVETPNTGDGTAPHYTIPPDNPFADSSGSEQPEIWAWGLRNPWRIGFDRLTGDLFIADVGQDSREEVNLELAGSAGGINYGWPRMEGIACYRPSSGCQTGSLALPIMDYSHGEGCSITGGYRYRGQGIPTLHGVYVFGDFCSKRIWAGTQSGTGAWSRATLLDTALSISSFGEDAAGELYVANLGGSVHRFVRVRPRLTVTRAGNGSGTATGPNGLACGASCSVEYEPGQLVTLAASPGATSWLAGWSGGCGGTGSCAVQMDGDRSVTVTFSLRPVFQFSAASYTVSEGSGAATITVQRLGTTAGTATVDYAIEPGSAALGADFTGPGGLLTGTLTFTPGQSSKTFTVPVVNDGQIEGPETVLLSLHHPTAGGVLGTPPTAVLTIVDNDVAGTIQFSPAAVSVSEATGQAVLTVTRNQTSTGVTVNWSVVPEGTTAVHGVDYGDPSSGQVDFGAQLTRTITIPLLNPAGYQGTRTLRVQLSNPSNGATLGAQKIATLTITDDEIGLQFSQPSYTASEGSASITIPVVRTGPSGAASVAFAAGPPGSGVPATASAVADACSPGADYVPVSGTLNFAAGDTSKTFTVKLCKDSLFEATPKIVGLALSAPQPGGVYLGAQATANLTINNVDVAGTLRWSAAAYSVNEGSGQVVLTVNRSGGMAGGVTVDYVISGGSATAGTDFTGPGGGALTGTLAFGPNVTSRTVTIPVTNDTDVESNETFTVTLQNVQGGATLGSPGIATVTIVDNDRTGTVQFSQATTTAQEDGTASVTVTRTGSTSQGASVGYTITGDTASVDQAVTPLTGTVIFPSGQGSRALSIKLVPDTAVDGNTALTVMLHTPSAGLALGAPNPATVTLIDNEGTVAFAAATFTVGEGNDFATITLTRTGGTAQPTTVHFATGDAGDTATPAATPGACSAGADYRPILDGSLTFSPGQTTRTFTVPLCRDTVVESPNPETLTLRLLSATAPATLGAQITAVLQIVENDAGGVLRFSSASYSVTEGTSTATLTVLRANGGAGNVTVPWSLGGNAVLNTDYGGPSSGQLAFGAGQTSASLSIPILNDALIDGLRNVVVTLGAPTGGATLGSPSVATLGINDNEPSVRFSSATYNVGESSPSVGVTVVRGGSTGSTVTVNVKTTGTGTAEGGAGPCGPGIDFMTATLPVTFAPGQTSKIVTIPLCPDTEVDGPETIGLVLDNVVGATLGTPNTAVIQIADNDVAGSAQFATAASSVSETQSTANVLVARAGGTASGLKIHWTITGGSAVHGGAPGPGVDYTGPLSGVLVFALNQVSQSIPIPVWPRSGDQGPRSVNVVLDWADGGGTLGARTSTTLWILDADVPDGD